MPPRMPSNELYPGGGAGGGLIDREKDISHINEVVVYSGGSRHGQPLRQNPPTEQSILSTGASIIVSSLSQPLATTASVTPTTTINTSKSVKAPGGGGVGDDINNISNRRLANELEFINSGTTTLINEY